MTLPAGSLRGPEELEEERGFLLRSLRDLEAERAAGDIDEADYAVLRRDYTARAAAVLRALGGDPEPGPVDTVELAGPTAGRREVARPARGRRRLRGALTVAAVLAGASAAGWAVAGSSGERLPGQEASGSIPSGTVDRISQAQALVSRGDVLAAVKLYDQILGDDPRNPVALSQRGWLVSRAGLIDEGLASIDAAIAAEPSYPDAHFFRAMILWQAKGDPAGAAAEFQVVLENQPPPDLASFVQDSRRRALAEAEAKPEGS